jgi:hypothetical protein
MGIHIGDMTERPQTQRHNDIFLMDAFVTNGYHNNKELFTLSWCRIYLQLLQLSDIANAEDVSHVHSQIWECEGGQRGPVLWLQLGME